MRIVVHRRGMVKSSGKRALYYIDRHVYCCIWDCRVTKFDEVKVSRGVPYIADASAGYLYNYILTCNFASFLELGTAHGTATCYMAAAIQELGSGGNIAENL